MEPLIVSAKFAPAPVFVGATTLISVVVVEADSQEQAEMRYTNEFYSGEV